MSLSPQTQPRLSLTEAYHATQRWLDHVGLRTVTIREPADGVVELHSDTHIARIRISLAPVGQGAALALLRASQEAGLTPTLFSATGFSAGAIGFATSQNIGLFDLGPDGDVIPMNGVASTLMPPEALEPAFANPIEAVEAEGPVSYFEAPTRDDEPEIDGPTLEAEQDGKWRTCPRCGSTHHPSTRMCASCGTDLAARVGGGQLLGARSSPLSSNSSPVPRAMSGGPILQCRTCGSHDIDLIRPD